MIQEVILTKKECELILKVTGEFYRGHVTTDGVNRFIDDIRTCYEYTFHDNKDVSNLLLSKIEKFGVKSMPSRIAVVRYDVGQGFDTHVDAGYGHGDRVKTISIQLTDESEYDGGTFVVWEYDDKIGADLEKVIDRKQGNMAIFDSKRSHYVTEVTRGTRYALVFWLKEENIV